MAGLAFSQTQSSIAKALQDSKRAENSAKADVYVQPKHVIHDTAQLAVMHPKPVVKKKKYKLH